MKGISMLLLTCSMVASMDPKEAPVSEVVTENEPTDTEIDSDNTIKPPVDIYLPKGLYASSYGPPDTIVAVESIEMEIDITNYHAEGIQRKLVSHNSVAMVHFWVGMTHHFGLVRQGSEEIIRLDNKTCRSIKSIRLVDDTVYIGFYFTDGSTPIYFLKSEGKWIRNQDSEIFEKACIKYFKRVPYDLLSKNTGVTIHDNWGTRSGKLGNTDFGYFINAVTDSGKVLYRADEKGETFAKAVFETKTEDEYTAFFCEILLVEPVNRARLLTFKEVNGTWTEYQKPEETSTPASIPRNPGDHGNIDNHGNPGKPNDTATEERSKDTGPDLTRDNTDDFEGEDDEPYDNEEDPDEDTPQNEQPTTTDNNHKNPSGQPNDNNVPEKSKEQNEHTEIPSVEPPEKKPDTPKVGSSDPVNTNADQEKNEEDDDADDEGGLSDHSEADLDADDYGGKEDTGGRGDLDIDDYGGREDTGKEKNQDTNLGKRKNAKDEKHNNTPQKANTDPEGKKEDSDDGKTPESPTSGDGKPKPVPRSKKPQHGQGDNFESIPDLIPINPETPTDDPQVPPGKTQGKFIIHLLIVATDKNLKGEIYHGGVCTNPDHKEKNKQGLDDGGYMQGSSFTTFIVMLITMLLVN
ncbi:hypothetical protein BdWA1_002538 [Babesia duncani]|uniref:Uncharacterized protein n=1 Tax=Babesia duncani TaxID=323732 RepID=A0AAD9UNR2_9APIC|nr:hypothetical protein BdWA1_002538 [Babesia duncani]